MSLDISPLIPTGRQIIRSYRGGRFLINDAEYAGAVFVFPDRTLHWDAADVPGLTSTHFDLILAADASVEVLLLGCGDTMQLPSPALRALFKEAGVALEPMDTGAACRTFNVLVGEDRRVAAALFPAG